MTWSRAERAWAEALFAAILPARPPLPPVGTIDLAPFWATLDQAAPPLLHVGARLGVWYFTWTPFWFVHRLRRFGRLDADDREIFLTRAATSRSFLVRQMLLTLKTLVCLAYFSDPEVRRRVGCNP